ncbi:MAG: zinc ribbon domain-containing protein [Candidatus Dependentiae bacterium]|nr:zinc ribbon domain-containing protein [Candidatus Dependentiae bacterium]
MKKLLLLTMAAVCGLGSVGISHGAEAPPPSYEEATQKACEACTFLNNSDARFCATCGTAFDQRPARAAREEDMVRAMGRMSLAPNARERRPADMPARGPVLAMGMDFTDRGTGEEERRAQAAIPGLLAEMQRLGGFAPALPPMSAQEKEKAYRSALAELMKKKGAMPAGPAVVQLRFEPIEGTGKYFGLGWLYSPTRQDWALVSCGEKQCSPVLNQDGRRNFTYVSPGAPTIELPKGLYYWRSGGAFKVDELGKTEEKGGKYLVQVSNVPQGEPFKWSLGSKKYVDLATRKQGWEMKRGDYDMDQDILSQSASVLRPVAASRFSMQQAGPARAAAVASPAALQGLRTARATVQEQTFPDGSWEGWLDVRERGDMVRIKVTGSEIGLRGLGLNKYSNFYYIDTAGNRLPKGLFYWQGAQKVAPEPTAGAARLEGGVWVKYKVGARPGDRGVAWDESKIKQEHPWK